MGNNPSSSDSTVSNESKEEEEIKEKQETHKEEPQQESTELKEFTEAEIPPEENCAHEAARSHTVKVRMTQQEFDNLWQKYHERQAEKKEAKDAAVQWAKETNQVAEGEEPVFVKALSGETHVLSHSYKETFGGFIERLADLLSIPAEQIRLIWSGQQVQPGRTFGDYSCPPGATLHMVLRLRAS